MFQKCRVGVKGCLGRPVGLRPNSCCSVCKEAMRKVSNAPHNNPTRTPEYYAALNWVHENYPDERVSQAHYEPWEAAHPGKKWIELRTDSGLDPERDELDDVIDDPGTSSEVREKLRLIKSRSMSSKQLSDVVKMWKKPIDAESMELVNNVHMIPATASKSSAAYHHSENVFLATPNLHGLIGTWNGKGRATVEVTLDGNGIIRYHGTDPTFARYKDMIFVIPAKIRDGFKKCLEIWNRGPEACRQFLDDMPKVPVPC